MESEESNNIHNLGTTLTTGHLAKLHLAVSQSLLAQELMGCAWNQTTFTTYRQLAQLFVGFAWNHGIGGIKQLLQPGNNSLTTGHLAKLHLAVSQSLLAQELMGCAWNQTTFTTYRQLAQLFGGFAWNHGITGISGIGGISGITGQ